MAYEALPSKKIAPALKIERKKRIFVPDGSLWWARTHAMTPTPDVLHDRIRVFFAALDENTVGRIGFVDLDKDDPGKVIEIGKQPVLDIGADGTFDDNGVVPASIITLGSERYLYYHGFQLARKSVRFLMLTGLAISKDGGNSFERYAPVPLLERTPTDTFIRSLAHVMREGPTFKVWYNGVNEWTNVNGKMLPVGNIRYMEAATANGFRDAEIRHCLAPDAREFSLSRPFVFKRDGEYKMLFSSRQRATNRYKLGYADSADGKNWRRNDALLDDSGPSGDWDAEMICYASLVTLGDKNYLFYNGNGFGATGFGYAEIAF